MLAEIVVVCDEFEDSHLGSKFGRGFWQTVVEPVYRQGRHLVELILARTKLLPDVANGEAKAWNYRVESSPLTPIRHHHRHRSLSAEHYY
jgi:hypothetical protein